MNEKNIIDLFDNENYKDIINITNPYNINNINSFELLYYLKSKLALDNFIIKDKEEVKKILFYYFYLVWEVKFENDYNFKFKKDELKINFSNLDKDILWLIDFKQYFILSKNIIFLDKIKDLSIENNSFYSREWAIEVDNIIDFCLYFTYECSELYSFSWEHFPLFKWLINNLLDEK